MSSPTVYLATNGNASYLSYLDEQHKPALLVSYALMESWPTRKAVVTYRQWCMDSGAFSVLYSGKTISLDNYIPFAKDMLDSDPTLAEVFALDVIRDWRQGLRNVERMWAAGVPAIPVFHIGEPEDVLTGYARDYPKVGIGGLGWLKGKALRAQYMDQCFARVWPCALHGLAVTDEESLFCVPWHSVDSSSWVAGPRYGTWRSYSSPGSTSKWSRMSAYKQYDLRHEVRHYLRVEEQARLKWATEMAEVDRRLRAANWRGYEAVREGEGDGAGHPSVA